MGRRKKNKEADAIGEPAEFERLTGDINTTNNTANESTDNKTASVITNIAASTSVADAITTATGTISVSTTIVNNKTSSFDDGITTVQHKPVNHRKSILLKRGDTDLS